MHILRNYVFTKYKIIHVVYTLLCLLLLCLLFLNILDSDSGREFLRFYNLQYLDTFDNGPMLTYLQYGFLQLFTNTRLFAINFLNFILAVSIGLLLHKMVKQKIYFVIIALFVLSTFIFLRIYITFVPYLLGLFFILFSVFYYEKYVQGGALSALFFSALFLGCAIYAKNHFIVFIPFFGISQLFLLKRGIFKDQFKKYIIVNLQFYGLFLIILLPYLVFNLGYFGLSFWHYPNNWFVLHYNTLVHQNFWHNPIPGSRAYFAKLPKILTLGYFPFIIFFIIFITSYRKSEPHKVWLGITLLICSMIPYVFHVVPMNVQYTYIFLLPLLYFLINSDFKNIALGNILLLIILSLLSLGENAIFLHQQGQVSDMAPGIKFINALDGNVLMRSANLMPYIDSENVITFDALKEDDFILFAHGDRTILLDTYNIRYIVENKFFEEKKFYDSFLHEMGSDFRYYEIWSGDIIYSDDYFSIYTLDNILGNID